MITKIETSEGKERFAIVLRATDYEEIVALQKSIILRLASLNTRRPIQRYRGRDIRPIGVVSRNLTDRPAGNGLRADIIP